MDLTRRLYTEARRIRAVDELLVEQQRQGELPYFVSARGEECVIAAAALATEAQDWLFPSPRDYGACLARGVSVEQLFHHFLATGEDAGKGRSRPNFFGFRQANIAQVAGSVGAHVPHAVGLAWAARVAGERLAALCMFGDGATSAGEFHNGANFAGVFRAPVVLLCRNNGFAGSFPVEKQCAAPQLADKAEAYGIRGRRVLGDDAVAVFEAVAQALAEAREGGGASLLEIVTYGLERDPFEGLERALGAEAAAIAAQAETEARQAFALAKQAPPPAAETLTTDVLAAPAGEVQCR